MERLKKENPRLRVIGIIIPRWWSGGIAGALTQVLVSPFDLLESRMMTLKKDRTMLELSRRAIRKHGFLSLYDGLTAQLLRQLTYTTLRFHLYDVGKRYVDEYNFMDKVLVATISGLMAGSVGIPTEMINTRMHVDRTLKEEYRRNYRHVFDGLRRVCREEGFRALYTGGFYSCVRAALLTIGQNAMFDQYLIICCLQSKLIYSYHYHFDDNSKILHLISSMTAALICAPLVQPFEILKTMEMTTPRAYLKTTSEKIQYMMRFGMKGLFRGIVPSLWRMIPSTIIMFTLYEQLRLNFGYYDDHNKINRIK